MNTIVRKALEHRFAVVLIALLVLLGGYFSFRNLTIEAFPDPTDTQVNIITLFTGQPAAELERQVSIPIERAVNGMPGLVRTRSTNLFGLSYVSLTFRDDVDVYAARAQTIERLVSARLPEGVQPELGSLSTPIGEIYRYTLKSDQANPLELRTLQDWEIRPRLLKLDGVAEVVSYGGLVREVQVHPDPVALAAQGLTMGDLEAALRDASKNASGGVVERGSEQLLIRSQGLFSDLFDIKQVSVATRGGTPIPLLALASVEDGWTPRQGVVGRSADEDVVQGIVLMRRGENPTVVLDRVRAKIEDINQRVMPKGTAIDVFYDRAELIDSTLSTVGRNLLEGASLVILVLFVFLLDLRAALLVAIVIPLSLSTAFLYLHWRGMSANLISMGSVDFGIIVDGAVVIVESIALRMAHALPSSEGQAPLSLTVTERVRRAVADVLRPTVFSLLIIIAAYLPIFMLERVEGRMFAPLAHTVVAALVGALIFSVTLVPVLATLAYRKSVPHRTSPLLVWATQLYRPVLRGALKKPLLVVAIALVSLFSSVKLLERRGSEFLPELNEGALYLTFTLPSNISLTESRKLMPRLASIIDRFPQVEARMSQLGRPEDGTDPKLSNNLEYFVKLRPAKDWPRETPDIGAVVHQMSEALSVFPGLEVNFSQPIRDNVNENISGQQGQIALKLFGGDLDVLQSKANEVKRALSEVHGVADLGIVKSGVVPVLDIRPQRAMLGRFGLTMDEVQGYISTALGGRVVSEFWEGERVFDVVLRLPESARESVEEIEALRVPTKTGGLVPLTTLADVHVGYGRASINREDGHRYVGIRMNVRGRDLGTFMADAQKVVAQKVQLPPGVSLAWGGEFESKERAMGRLLLVVPVALVVTLGLLFNAFGSLFLATLVLVNVPFALVGGALALWAFDMPFSIAAAVGFIALIGQASLNGVLVLSAIEQRLRDGAELDEAILEGATDRLRAVLMTASLAALGLVPAALSHSMGAETQRPIAVVIVGGTISAALLTLVVLPVVYRAAQRVKERLASRSSGPPS